MRQLIERGRRSYERGDYLAALADFREAREPEQCCRDPDPDNPQLRAYLAMLDRTDARPRPLAVS